MKGTLDGGGGAKLSLQADVLGKVQGTKRQALKKKAEEQLREGLTATVWRLPAPLWHRSELLRLQLFPWVRHNMLASSFSSISFL